MNLTIGQIKGWKSKIYVTAVLDSFQDRKGITLKEVNNKQIIGLYSMKYGRNKTKEGTRETRPLPSRVCVSRTVPFLIPCDFHVRCRTAAKMYFLAPKTVGSRYWVKLSPPWCRDAENCGNPIISLR